MNNAKKRYDIEHMSVIAIKAKKEVINNIKNTAIDNGISAPKLLTAMYNYCMENNVNIEDLKKYI